MAEKPHSISAEAVVLRQREWGEADRLVFVYSREHGKLKTLAKGARKLKSRKAGHLQPFSQVKLMLAAGRDLWIITQVETVQPFLEIKDDLVRIGYAAYVTELLDRFTPEEGANTQLYKLLVETFDRINREPDGFLAVRYYEIRLLDLLGFRPELQHCVMCGKEITAQDQFFSNGLGGVVCPDCGIQASGARRISMTALKYLRHFQRSNYATAARATLTAPVREELEGVMHAYLTYTLERHINSTDFLRTVRSGV